MDDEESSLSPIGSGGDSRLPQQARREIGEAIFTLQHGEQPGLPLCRPMPSIAPGAAELRVRDRSGAYRVFYYLRDERGVLIFHAFLKKTQATAARDIALGRKRLKELLDEAF